MDYASQHPMNGRAPDGTGPTDADADDPTPSVAVGTLESEAAEQPAATPAAPWPMSVGPHARPDPKPSFLAELAQAMQAAAGQERDRIALSVADDAAVHVDRVRARAAAETDELRRLAEQDVEGIAAWEAAEIERVRATAARQTEARRERLERYLVRHSAIIDIEIDGVNGAVDGYRASLDGFFDRLAGSNDPAEIARLASSLPEPPDLDAVRAESRTAAIARFAEEDAEAEAVDDDSEGPAAPGPGAEAAGMVGVMDPRAVASGEGPAASEGPAGEGPAGALSGEGDADPADTEAAGTGPAEASQAAPAPAVGQPTTVARLLRSIAAWTVADERADNGASPKSS